MSEITKIDVQVFPDYCGGLFAGNGYVDPQTLEHHYFNTFADEGLVQAWRKRVLEVRADVHRMIIHVSDDPHSSGKGFLVDYVGFLREEGDFSGRFIDIRHTNIDQIMESIAERALGLAPDVVVEAYGHHRGDCVPKEAMKVVTALGLPESCFREVEELGVGDMLMDRIELIRGVNPELYYYCSDQYLKDLLEVKNYDGRGLVLNQRKYLFLYCTPDQITEAAKVARTWEEFEALIGGDFANFDFLEDYFRLRDLAENVGNR